MPSELFMYSAPIREFVVERTPWRIGLGLRRGKNNENIAVEAFCDNIPSNRNEMCGRVRRY